MKTTSTQLWMKLSRLASVAAALTTLVVATSAAAQETRPATTAPSAAAPATPPATRPALEPLLPPPAADSAVPAPVDPAAEAQPAAKPQGTALVTEGLDERGTLRLTVNKSSLIRTRALLRRVNVAQPEVADVNLIGPTQVLITGKKAGQTQIILWDDADHSQIIEVAVSVDFVLLHDQLVKAFPEAQVEVTAANNAVILRGRAPSIQIAQQIQQLALPYSPQVVNLLEVSGGQQVVLKVRFAEVSRSVSTNLGFNAFATDGRFAGGINFAPGDNPLGSLANGNTSGVGATTLFGSAHIGNTAFEFFINALRQNNLLRTLAEPNLMTMSGQSASFLAGGEFPIPIPQAGGGATAITVEYKEFGVRLNFLPVVMGDGRIRLKVNPEVSQLDPTHSVSFNGFNIPALTERKLQTVVELNEGQTFALAGLLNNDLTASKNVTPVLGDIPVLGALFRSVSYQRSETELVVLVTPFLAGALDPDQVPQAPGEHWRYPSEAELFANQDLGGPIYTPPSSKAGAPAEFRGHHGFTPATAPSRGGK